MFHIAVTLLSGQNTSIRVQGETRMDHIKREAQKNLKIGLYASPDSKAMGQWAMGHVCVSLDACTCVQSKYSKTLHTLYTHGSV